jgi:hypothetical protein
MSFRAAPGIESSWARRRFPAARVSAMFPADESPRLRRAGSVRGREEKREEVTPDGRRGGIGVRVREPAKGLAAQDFRLEIGAKSARPCEQSESNPQNGPVFRALRSSSTATGAAVSAFSAGRDRKESARDLAPPRLDRPFAARPAPSGASRGHRHCEERSDEAIRSGGRAPSGLLRCCAAAGHPERRRRRRRRARNDPWDRRLSSGNGRA